MSLKKRNALVVQSDRISYGKIWVRIPAKVSISTEPKLSIALTNFCVTIYFCLFFNQSINILIFKFPILTTQFSIGIIKNYRK